MSDTQQGKCRICQESFHPFPMGEKNEWKFIACKICGSVMVDPWPTAEELDQFFADIQPEIVHVPQPEAEIAEIKKKIKKIVRGEPAGKTFIDVCCRQGYAVEAAWQMGMKPQGIDSHDFFYKFAKEKYPSNTFTHATAMEFTKSGVQVDVVFAQEAFCESLDPEALAAALAKLVAPGGIVYIEEPDGNSFNVPKVFANWSFVEPPLNFFYPSKKGLTKLLARNGLKVEKSFFVWAPHMKMILTKS